MSGVIRVRSSNNDGGSKGASGISEDVLQRLRLAEEEAVLLREELAKARGRGFGEGRCYHRIIDLLQQCLLITWQITAFPHRFALSIWRMISLCQHVPQGDETIAEKADESLEAMRTGRIDAGDLKRLSPFSGMSFIPNGLSAFPQI